MVITVAALVLLGLIFGSFVNALVWRLHEKRDWVRGRSECPHCHHVLAPKDLVPVFSWLALGGKCRYCRKRIPDSPIVELVLPILFVVSYLYWPEPLGGGELFVFALWLLFLVGFLALAVYDLRWMLLPDKVVFPLIWLAIFEVVVRAVWLGGGWRLALSAALGAAVIGGLFYLLHAFSKGKWIGFGDVKLAIVLGLLAGDVLQALLVLFVASCLGTLIAIPLVLAGKAGRKSLLPFGPLLIAGVIVVVLFGRPVIDWYTGVMFAL